MYKIKLLGTVEQTVSKGYTSGESFTISKTIKTI